MIQKSPQAIIIRSTSRSASCFSLRLLVVPIILISISCSELLANEAVTHHTAKNSHSDKAKEKEGRDEKSHPKPPTHPETPKGHGKSLTVPTHLTAEAVSLFQINLAWADNSTNEIGFKIERSQDGRHFKQIAQVLPDTVTYRDLNRFPDTKYFYRVRAFYENGHSDFSAVARARTPAPECRLSVVGSFLSGNPQSPSHDGMNLVAASGGGSPMSSVLTSEGKIVQLGYYSSATVSNLSGIVAISVGASHGLALGEDGRVTGWGDDYYGQATPPPGLSNVTAVAAGGTHSLALKNDGTVVAWGADYLWQSRPPTNLTGVVAISAGNNHSLALKSDGSVVGWGWNDQNAAQPPPGLRDVVAISAGNSHSLALKSDGSVVGWGISPAANIPANLTGVIAIAALEYDSVVLRDDGTIYMWSGPDGGFPVFITPFLKLTGAVALGAGILELMPLTLQPSSPSDLRIKLHSADQVELSWKDLSVGETAYIVERELTYPYSSYPPIRDRLATLNANSTNFFDTTAVIGNKYSYTVRSKNDCMESSFGVKAGATISAPTNAPAYNLVYPKGVSAILSWYEEGVGALEYQLERAGDVGGQPGVWNQIAIVRTNASWGDSLMISGYTDPVLPLNSTNWYRVRTVNGLGISPYSEPINVVIAPLSAPLYLNALADAKGVRLNWSTIFWREVAGFRIERSTNATGSLGTWKEIAVVLPTANLVGEYIDTTATAGSTNYYRIRAVTEAGTSDYSELASIALFAPASAIVFASTISDAVYLSASLPWPFNYSGGQFPIQFERADDVGGVPGTWISITPQPNSIHSGYVVGSALVDTGLNINRAYWYRAKLSTWLGDSPFSDPVRITFTPPPPPAELTARIGSTNQIILRWRIVSVSMWFFSGMPIGLPLDYKVERTIDDGTGVYDWNEIATVGPTNSYYGAFVDTVSVTGLAYRYRVCSFDNAGQSVFWESNPVKLIPPPRPAISASPFINYVRLDWSIQIPGTIGSRIERAPDVSGAPGSWTQVATIPPAEIYQSSYTDTLPTQVAGYWYRVQNFNWIGDSEYSVPVFVQIQPPQAPTRLEARIGSTNQISLSWSYYNGDADRFEFQRAKVLDGIIGTWETIIANYTLDVTLPPPSDTNAVALTDYAYRMRAGNPIGWSPYSDVCFIRTAPPSAPTAGSTEYIAGRVTLNWNPPFDQFDYGDIGGYEVERAVVVGGLQGNWVRVFQGNAYSFANSYTDDEPPVGSVCMYRIRAANWIGGSDYTPVISVNISPPPAPHLIYAVLGQTNKVNLTIYTEYPHDQAGMRIERASDVSGVPGIWEEVGEVITNGIPVVFSDTNVVAYTTNWYRARAFHQAGFSDYSAARSVAVMPPPAPDIFSASIAADEVRLFCQLNTMDWISGFKIERAPDNGGVPGNWSKIAFASGEFNPSGWWIAYFTDFASTPNATFWYRVRASNWIGDGAASNERSVTTMPPNAPLYLTGRIGTTNTVLLDWWGSLPSAQGEYLLERASDVSGNPQLWSEIAAITNASSYFYDTNVTANSTNWYRVRAFNSLGISPYSQPLQMRIVPPDKVSGLSAGTLANRIFLSWRRVTYNYGEIAGYQIERTTDTNATPVVWTGIAPTVISDTYLDTNLTKGVTYWYRVRSHNWVGASENSSIVNETIVPPATPYYLEANVIGANLINLEWQAGWPLDQEGFDIERSTATQNNWSNIARIFTGYWATIRYSDTNPAVNVTNYYRVSGFNVVGKSAYSSSASAFISSPAVSRSNSLLIEPLPHITQLTLTNRNVSLSWTTTSGTTNIVEAAMRLTDEFSPISPPIVITGSGTVITNFLDVGALTNSASRFYRIRVLP